MGSYFDNIDYRKGFDNKKNGRQAAWPAAVLRNRKFDQAVLELFI